MNQFYTYIYLDPRKAGQYCYEDLCLLYKPIYVGKGKGRRYLVEHGRTPIFKNKINKIQKSGLNPIILKLYENLNEQQSFELEKKLIDEIGRIDLGTGPLVNMMDGGDGGSSGRIISEETKNKISESQKDKKISKETRKKISENNNNYWFGKHLSEEHRNKMRENHADFRGENHPRHKLTEEQVIQIKLLLKEEILTQKEIADMFGVKQSIISKIKIGKLWSHIKLGEN